MQNSARQSCSLQTTGPHAYGSHWIPQNLFLSFVLTNWNSGCLSKKPLKSDLTLSSPVYFSHTRISSSEQPNWSLFPAFPSEKTLAFLWDIRHLLKARVLTTITLILNTTEKSRGQSCKLIPPGLSGISFCGREATGIFYSGALSSTESEMMTFYYSVTSVYWANDG